MAYTPDVAAIAHEMAEFYQCGMTAPEIVYWMTTKEGERRSFDRAGFGSASTVSRIMARFCGDCTNKYQAQMQREGRCRVSDVGLSRERDLDEMSA